LLIFERLLLALNKAEVALPAKLGEQSYTLNIKALHTDGSQVASGEPFQVSGILFEFIENHVARNEGQV